MARNREIIKNRISVAERFTIITHQNPDGDAIGSSLGLYHALHNIGKICKVIVPNDFPAFLKWMPASDEILVYERQKSEISDWMSRSDFVFYLDFNDLQRLGKLRKVVENREIFSILIDHHPEPLDFSDILISDTSVSSTAELVYGFIQEFLGSRTIEKIVSECLYAGMMTDTGSFSYNSSRPETYHILAELLANGIDKDEIYSNVYDNFSEDRMKLLGYCLDKKMTLLSEYGTAFICLTAEEKKKYNFQPGDSEGFVNFPLSISGVFFSVFFMENGGKIKLSFRSKGDFPVNTMAAKYFQGGGHLNAAGGESELPMEKAVEKFLKLLPEYIEDYRNGKI